MVPLGYYGDSSHYIELPKPDEIFDYEKYKTPNWALEESKNEVKIEDKQIGNQKSKFIL